MMSWCLRAARSYRGPLIAIGVGVGFVLVGAVPVAVTFSTNAKNSATIIGVGFIGFGLLLILPGIGWCLVRRAAALRCCRSKKERLRPDDDVDDETGGGIERRDTELDHRSASQGTESKTALYIMNCETSDDKPGVFFDVGDKRASSRGQEPSDQDAEIEDVRQDDGDVRLTR